MSNIQNKDEASFYGIEAPKTPAKKKLKRRVDNQRIALNSPYNFIELNEEIWEAYSSLSDIPSSGTITDDLISGEISYLISVITPIVFEHGLHSLTASMVRGLVRSNLQILSFSSVDNDISDAQFRYRNFLSKDYRCVTGAKVTTTYGIDRHRYARTVAYDNICAGVIFKNQTGMYIAPSSAFGGKGYYRLNIRHIQSKSNDWRKKYNVSWNRILNIFDTLGENTSTGRSHGKSKMIRDPFIKRVSWKPEFKNNNEVGAVGEEGVYENDGWIINPGYFYNNISMYLIADEHGSSKKDIIQLTKEDIDSYNEYINKQGRNYSFTTKNQTVDHLPFLGERKPVFYILHNDNRHCDFGFTKLFPIRWKFSLKHGIPQIKSKKILDYAKAILGFHENQNEEADSITRYEGRVAFFEPHKVEEREEIKTRLMLLAPKPHSVKSYIHDDDNEGYNSEHFRINGIKQYWLREEVLDADDVSPVFSTEVKGENTGTQYIGKIRFYNLREDELGLLLWSIELNEECEQNIGAGKPYGYGRISVKIQEVNRILNTFPSDNIGVDLSMRTESLSPIHYIKNYQNKLNNYLKGKLETNRRLQDFFLMKSKSSLIDSNKSIYEKLPVYRKRNTYFPKITDITSNKKWIIVPQDEIEMIPFLSWEQFVDDYPSEMKEMHPEIDILFAYKELEIIKDLFASNKNYYIREEILREYVELSEIITNLIAQKRKIQQRSVKYKTVEENIQTCIRKISMLKNTIKEYEKKYQEEGVPILNLSIVSASYQKQEKHVDMVLRLEIPESSVMIKVSNLQLVNNHDCIFDSKEIFFITGGKGHDFYITLPVFEAELEQSFVQMKANIEYQYRKNGNLLVMKYENQIEIPLLESEYKELVNPYSSWLGNPISDKNMFFGREQLLQKIKLRIEDYGDNQLSGRNIIIYGQKRTGKTTLLFFLRQLLQYSENDKYIVVDIGNIGSALQIESKRDGSGSVNLRLFFRRMIDAAEDELINHYESLYEELEEENFLFPSLSGVTDAEAMQLCENFYKSLSSRVFPDKKIVLLIDEFTYFYDMITRGYVDEYFMQFWKAFIQNTNICAILVGQDFMDDFRNRFPNAFGASEIMRISYLDYASSVEMIKRPFIIKNGYDGFTDECVNELFRLTAGSAFYIMHLCSGLVDYLNEKKNNKVITTIVLKLFLKEHWMNVDSIKRIDKTFFESLYKDGTHLEWDNDNLELLHEIASRDTGEGVEKSDILMLYDDEKEDIKSDIPIAYAEYKLQRLLFRDVLVEKNGKLKIRVELFKEWLREVY